MKLSVLFRQPSPALILLCCSLPLAVRLAVVAAVALAAALSGAVSQRAWAFEPDEVPRAFRATFVNCMVKGESDPLNGQDYAAQWLASGTGGDLYARYCLAISRFRAGDAQGAAETLIDLAGDAGLRGTPQGTLRGTPQGTAIAARFLLLAGDILDSIGAFEPAFRAYSQALAENSEDPDTWVSRALVRASLGDFEGSLADLDRALALDAEHGEALVFRGLTYLSMQDLDRAADDALEALLLSPKDPSALWLRAQIALADGDREQAVADLERIIRRGDSGLKQQAQDALSRLQAKR